MTFPVRTTFGVLLLLLAAAMPAQAGPRFGFGLCPLPTSAQPSFARAIHICNLYLIYIHQQLPEVMTSDYFALAQLYHFDRQYDLAAQNYSKAIGWWHDAPEPYFARGDAYLAQGMTGLAEQDYTRARSLRIESPERDASRCWLRAIRGGPYELALADCDAALKARPGDASALFSRGLVRFRTGAHAQAIIDLDAALARKPALARALYVRGLAKRGANDPAGAEADIAAAKKTQPDIAEAYGVLGIGP